MPTHQPQVLIVDDDAAVGMVVMALLQQAGMAARHVTSAELALIELADNPFDVLVTDLRMPGIDGMELLQRSKAQWPEIPVVMITAHGTVPDAVEAMKRGAADFVTKPFDREELLYVVRKALASSRPDEVARPPVAPGRFVGVSPAIQECYRLIERAAPGSATVLLRGESGTGKELAAKAIHDRSPRKDGPFVPVHCGAFPEALLESELFGYEKGAFTGANARKPGRVELAAGGTLFFDEIGDITPTVQVKLLRLLQAREYQRLGGTELLKADVRFVAATHRDLEALVENGQFREDLFFRLSVVPLWLPSLRERPEDVEPLARHFCGLLGPANQRPDATLAPDAIDRLRQEPWPGNVRQLENFIERLVVMSENPTIRAADVERELARQPRARRPAAAAPVASITSPTAAPPTADGAPLGGEVASAGLLDTHRREAEREALVAALGRASNNRTLAARLLGISRRTLYNKLEEYGLM